MLYLTSFVASLLFTSSRAAGGGGWAYDKPEMDTTHWKHLYAECAYSRQSPINIPDSSFEECAENDALHLEWTSESAHYAIRNTGYSLKAQPLEINHAGGEDLGGIEVSHHANDTQIRLQNRFYTTYGSRMHQEYCFDSVHFHWGKTSADGSEHLVGGKSYPLEMHLVHYSCSYETAGEALKDYSSGKAAIKYDDENVLAVIGVFFEIGDPNPILDKILHDMIVNGIYMNEAQEFEDFLSFYYTEFNIRELLPESTEFIGYLGSLTTPPCYETVRWHLMKQPMTVSEEQMEAFRMMLSGTNTSETQAPNFRPIQNRGGRKIWSCASDLDEDILYEDKLVAPSSEDDDDDEAKWMAVAITFIILFVFMFAGCLFISYTLRSVAKQIQQLQGTTKSVEMGRAEEEPEHQPATA